MGWDYFESGHHGHGPDVRPNSYIYKHQLVPDSFRILILPLTLLALRESQTETPPRWMVSSFLTSGTAIHSGGS
jgi:hypothetical protein